MFRRMEWACAAALLAAAAGCSAGSFLASFVGPNGKPQVVSGSVDQVSVKLQAALSNAGMAINIRRQGEDVRLAGVTKSGKRFALVLRRQKTDQGENTAVSVEWQTDPDEQFWLMVLEALAVAAPV